MAHTLSDTDQFSDSGRRVMKMTVLSRTADPRAFYREGPVWVSNARRLGRDCLEGSSDRPRKLRRSGRFRAAFDNRARSDAQGEANDRHPKGRSAGPRAGMMERWRLAL